VRADPTRPVADLRAATLGVVAWATALFALGAPTWLTGAGLLGLVAVVVRRHRRGGPPTTQAGWLVAAAAVACSAVLHVESVTTTPVDDLARQRATVHALVQVRSDPVVGRGRRVSYVHFRATLLEISKGLGKTVDIDALLDKIVSYAYQILDVDRVAILLADDAGELTLKIARDKRGGDTARAVPQSIARTALKDKVAILSDNAGEDTRFGGQSILMQQIRSAICCPLIGSEDRPLGVLYVDNVMATHRFSDEDFEFCIAFAGIAAHESVLGEGLLAYLRDRNDIQIIGRRDSDPQTRVPTIAFKAVGRDSADIVTEMDKGAVGIRHGDFHSRRLIESLDLAADHGVVRVSMVHYNTVEEVDRLIGHLDRALA